MAQQNIIPRYYDKLRRFVSAQKSVLVLGPRGIGKTSFLSALIGELPGTVVVLDLLQRSVFERYLRNPDLLGQEVKHAIASVSGEPITIFIDEIQKLPFLLDEIQRLIEEYKPRVTFVLTGSSARKLKRTDANLLAGRALSVEFFPLGIDEVNYQEHETKLLQYGCLPEVFTTEDTELRREFLSTYVGTYLDEEINREADVRNLPGFARFLEIAAAENGTPLNYRNIARSTGVADVTVKDYYTLLQDTLVAYSVPAWTHSVRKQILQASKIYLFDNGVINALTGELGTELRPSTRRFGVLFENFVVTQIIQQLSKVSSPLKVYHYRERSGREVDLILQKNPYAPPIAIEIKSSENPDLRSVKSLVEFKKLYPTATAIVICRTPQPYEANGLKYLAIKDGIEYVIEKGNE
jgi:predicted AAA+ superfamily ATPase